MKEENRTTKIICTVRDLKAGVSGPIFVQHNKAVAIRSFEEIVNNPQSDVYKHPEDYCLMEIGQYDETTSIITPESTPLPLCRAEEVYHNPAGVNTNEISNDGAVQSTESEHST